MTDGTPHRDHHLEGEGPRHQYNFDHDKNRQNDQCQPEDRNDPYQYYDLVERKNYNLKNRDGQSQQ